MSTNGRLEGKVAIITGAGTGIGRATAQLFAVEGAFVAVVDIEKFDAKETVALIENDGGKAISIRADVSKSIDCMNAIGRTIEEFGSIDILMNNAGIIRRSTVLEITEEEWDRVMAVNVKSVYLMSREAIPHMQKNGGVILNTSSGWGLVGGGRAISYCASKGAVIQMTRAMAIDHGSQNIRVNAICPGDTDTGMLRNEARQLGESEEAFLADAADRPLGRYGASEEIAQAALFLASSDSSYVTGTTLVVDGGGLA